MDRAFPQYNRRYDNLSPLMDDNFTSRNRAAQFRRPYGGQRQHFTTGYSLYGRKYTQQPEYPNQQGQQQHQVQGQGQDQRNAQQSTEEDSRQQQQYGQEPGRGQNAQYASQENVATQQNYSQQQYGQGPGRGQNAQYASQENVPTQQTSTASRSSNDYQAQGYYQGYTSSSTIVYEDDPNNAGNNTQRSQSGNSTDPDDEQQYQQGYYQNPNGGGSNQSQPDTPQPQGYYPSNDSNENRNTESLSYSTDGSCVYLDDEAQLEKDASSSSDIDIDYNKYRKLGKRHNQFHTGDRRGKCRRTRSSFSDESDFSEMQTDRLEEYEPESKRFCKSLKELQDNGSNILNCETNQANMPENEFAVPPVGTIVETVPQADEEKVVGEAECKATSLAENIICEESPACQDNNPAPDNASTSTSPHPTPILGVFKRLLFRNSNALKKGSK